VLASRSTDARIRIFIGGRGFVGTRVTVTLVRSPQHTNDFGYMTLYSSALPPAVARKVYTHR
jgi:hypothetical protein